MSQTAVIVGAGHAGAELALQLREQGWSGAIRLLGAEPGLPYHRPPLSKAFMTGSVAAEQLAIRPAAAFDKAEVQREPESQVQALDPASSTLTLSDGRQIRWSVLALATGARPRQPTLPGWSAAVPPENLFTLRTIADAVAIRARCVPGARLVILGAGYIGLELAASAIALGVQVSIVEAQPRVLSRVAGGELAAFLADAHRAAGVALHLGVQIAAAEPAADGTRLAAVRLEDGSRLPLDLLVAGIGVVPNVELAQAAGIAVQDGIVVDEHACTSLPGIVAAGDCTRHPCALYGREVRLESVPNALEQARTAAATLAGKHRPHRQAPWFWSDQFDLRLKSVGLLSGHDRTVVRGDPVQRVFSVFYLQGTRILAVDTVNSSPDFLAAKRIVAEDLRIPAEILADASRPLKDVLPPPAPAA